MKLHWEQRAARLQQPRESAPFDRWLSPEGDVTSLFFRERGNYVVRFPELADFDIALDRPRIICTPAIDISDEVLANLYFNQIVPLVLGFHGDLVLHASAVSINDRAIAFLGPSRRGKSTLAAAFATNGHPFLTDDGLIVDRVGDDYIVRPRSPILRLLSDSASAIFGINDNAKASDRPKERIAANSDIPHRDEPTPLDTIFLITEPRQASPIEIIPLSRPASVNELLKHSFILDVEDRDRLERLFDQLIGLSESVQCVALNYSRHYSELPEVLGAVLRHVHHQQER